MFWRTAGAMVLALLTWLSVALSIGFLLSLWNRLTTTVRPEIIDFFVAIIATIVGMVAARAACDKVLKVYARRPIFVLFIFFASLSVVGMTTEFLSLGKLQNPITVSAHLIAMTVAAWVIFWRRDDERKDR